MDIRAEMLRDLERLDACIDANMVEDIPDARKIAPFFHARARLLKELGDPVLEDADPLADFLTRVERAANS